MQLLIKRDQEDSTLRTTFNLWIKFELTKEEEALLDKYKMRKSVITEGSTKEDIRKAVIYALMIGIFVGVTLYAVPGISADYAVIGALLSVPVFAFLIWNKTRETLTVADLIKGREFRCPNIMNLLDKEKHFQNVARNFNDFVGLTKTWNTRQVVMFEEGRDEPTIHRLPHVTPAA